MPDSAGESRQAARESVAREHTQSLRTTATKAPLQKVPLAAGVLIGGSTELIPPATGRPGEGSFPCFVFFPIASKRLSLLSLFFVGPLGSLAPFLCLGLSSVEGEVVLRNRVGRDHISRSPHAASVWIGKGGRGRSSSRQTEQTSLSAALRGLPAAQLASVPEPHIWPMLTCCVAPAGTAVEGERTELPIHREGPRLLLFLTRE